MWSTAFIVAGAFAWVGAVIHWRRVTRWLAAATTTTASVVRLEGAVPGQRITPGVNVAPRTTVIPVVRFTGSDGTRHELRSRMGLAYERAHELKEIEIMYDPTNPSDVRLGKRADRDLSVTLMVMGTIVLVLGVVGILRG